MSDVVSVTERQFVVADEAVEDPVPPEERWRRLREPPATTDKLTISTGISSGVVHVAVEVRDGAPPTVELEPWDTVVEISFPATGRLRVGALMDDAPRDLPVLNPLGPGPHRLRVHAEGRDANFDGVDHEPRERYLLIVWPGPPAPEVVHKRTDRAGSAAPGASTLASVFRPAPQPAMPPQRLPVPEQPS